MYRNHGIEVFSPSSHDSWPSLIIWVKKNSNSTGRYLTASLPFRYERCCNCCWENWAWDRIWIVRVYSFDRAHLISRIYLVDRNVDNGFASYEQCFTFVDNIGSGRTNGSAPACVRRPTSQRPLWDICWGIYGKTKEMFPTVLKVCVQIRIPFIRH